MHVSLACNFDMDANTADGSCLFTGSVCDDMDVNTINDMINDSCVCAGTDSTTFVLEFERLEFGMFPNPTTGEVTFRVDGVRGGLTLQVMDGAGRVVWSEKILPFVTTLCLICLVARRNVQRDAQRRAGVA